MAHAARSPLPESVMSFVRIISVALVATACGSGIKTVQVTPAPRHSYAVATDTAVSLRTCPPADSAGQSSCAIVAGRTVAHALKP